MELPLYNGDYMDGKNFTEDDKEKLVKFLNFVGKKAKWEVDTNEMIEGFRLLSHMQQVILPKVDKHILEVVKVVEAENSESGDKE